MYSFIYSKNLCLRGRNTGECWVCLPSQVLIHQEGIYKWSSSQRWPAENWHRTSYTERVRKSPHNQVRWNKRETERDQHSHVGGLKEWAVPSLGGPLTVWGSAGTERDLWGTGGGAQQWSVRPKQSKFMWMVHAAPCVPQLELCVSWWGGALTAASGVWNNLYSIWWKCCWLIEHVKEVSLQSFMLQIYLWMMLIDKVEQLKLIVIKSTHPGREQ